MGGNIKKLMTFLKALETSTSYKFTIKSFEDRLRLQKIVYIAKYFDINLGYSYNQYIRGPYSPDLARDYYKLAEDFENKLPEEYPQKVNRLVKKPAFSKFASFIDKYHNDPEMLELIATALMIMNISKLTPENLTDDNKKALIDAIHSMKPYFGKEKIRKAIDIAINEVPLS